MRTLFLSTATHWSGSARAFAVAARGLAARGTPVTAVCRAGSSVAEGFAAQGIDVVALPVTRSITGDAWRLRAVLKERVVEVAFVHTEREQLVVSSAMRLAGRGSVVRRIPAGSSPTAGRFGVWASRVATSRHLFALEGDRARAVGAGDAHVAPHGVDVDHVENARDASRHHFGIAADTQLIVCTIDNAPTTRVTTALRALALLAERHPTLRLLLVGRAASADDTRMHAAALGVAPLVKIVGERTDLPTVLAAADVGWVATEGDDGAFACLDFMAAGVPIVAERSPVLSHFVPDGIAGVLLQHADAGDTASIVARLLRNPDKRIAMGMAGRTRARRDFSERAMIDGFEAAADTTSDRASRVGE